jgi:hypothetical protein
VRAHIPHELIDFRQHVQHEAQKLYGALRGAAAAPTRMRR